MLKDEARVQIKVAAVSIRKMRELTARLVRSWSFTEHDLAPRSVYQLATLIHLLAGHRNYVGQHTVTCYTLERIFGEAIFDEPLIEPKTGPETTGAKPAVVN
jgi:hypothetical protein